MYKVFKLHKELLVGFPDNTLQKMSIDEILQFFKLSTEEALQFTLDLQKFPKSVSDFGLAGRYIHTQELFDGQSNP